MRRWSVRSSFLAAALCAAFMVFGAGAAMAFEGTTGGWYWQNPLLQGYSFNDLAVTSSGAVAVGDGGVVFTSANGGVKWTQRRSGLHSKLLAVDFVNASDGWAAGPGGLIATTNGGVTWASVDLPNGSSGFYQLTDVSFVDATHGWVCGLFTPTIGATSYRILATTDGGDTWSVETLPANVKVLKQVDFVNVSDGWATGWGYDSGTAKWGYILLKTTDGGTTWTASLFGDGQANLNAIDFTSASEGWVATASVADYAPAKIWHSTDGGSTWAVSTTMEGATITDLAASASGECYASGQTQGLGDWEGFVLHTTDDGATWKQEYSDETVKPQAIDFSSSTAIAVGAGGFFLTRDASTGTWSQTAPGVRANLTHVQFLNANLGWAVGWKSTILRTIDGGRTWSAASVPGGISLESIDMVTKKIGWAVGCSGPHVPYADLDAGYGAVVLKTTDGGLHWKFQIDRATSPGLAGVDFFNTKIGMAVGSDGLVVRTTDGGRTWWFRTVGTVTLRDVQFLAAHTAIAVGGETGTVSSSGVIWRTADGGVTWTNPGPQPAPDAPLRSIKMDLNTITVVGDRGQIYTSGDGLTWTYSAINDDLTQDPPYPHYFDIGLCTIPQGALVAADDADGWILADGGDVWTHNRAGSAPLWQLPPVISSCDIPYGPVGATVTLYGSGFTDVSSVKIQDVPSTNVTPISDTELQFVVPSGVSQGTSTISVETPSGIGTSIGLFNVTVAPSITDFTPPSGPVGSTVTVYGGGFSHATGATVQGVAAVFTPVSDAQLQLVVPSGVSVGTGAITVTTALGTATSPTNFSVTAAGPMIAAGAGAQSIVLAGSGRHTHRHRVPPAHGRRRRTGDHQRQRFYGRHGGGLLDQRCGEVHGELRCADHRHRAGRRRLGARVGDNRRRHRHQHRQLRCGQEHPPAEPLGRQRPRQPAP